MVPAVVKEAAVKDANGAMKIGVVVAVAAATVVVEAALNVENDIEGVIKNLKRNVVEREMTANIIPSVQNVIIHIVTTVVIHHNF